MGAVDFIFTAPADFRSMTEIRKLSRNFFLLSVVHLKAYWCGHIRLSRVSHFQKIHLYKWGFFLSSVYYNDCSLIKVKCLKGNYYCYIYVWLNLPKFRLIKGAFTHVTSCMITFGQDLCWRIFQLSCTEYVLNSSVADSLSQPESIHIIILANTWHSCMEKTITFK